MIVRIVYVNGQFVPEAEAKISIFDRGFLFADSAYEVTTVLKGRLVSWDGHVGRFERSLSSLKMIMPVSTDQLLRLHRKLIKLNKLTNGLIYMQASRGIADRDFSFPDNLKHSLIMFSQEIELLDPNRLNRCLKVVTVPEVRWKQRNIKTTQLLGASLMKTDAQSKGFDDAWFVEDGFITEGTSSNAFIILKGGKIVTRKIGEEILAGETRISILKIAQVLGFRVEERPFTVMEAESAEEAFMTSSTNFVTSVSQINGKEIGNGKVGAITKVLREQYILDAINSSV